MIDRSNEIIKNLNRLANDRTLSAQIRNRIRDAVQHIRELQDFAESVGDQDVTIPRNPGGF